MNLPWWSSSEEASFFSWFLQWISGGFSIWFIIASLKKSDKICLIVLAVMFSFTWAVSLIASKRYNFLEQNGLHSTLKGTHIFKGI